MLAKALRKIVASNAVAAKKNLVIKAVAILVGAVERNWETALRVKEQEVGTYRAIVDAAEEAEEAEKAQREGQKDTDWLDRISVSSGSCTSCSRRQAWIGVFWQDLIR
jgi:hypothetical protein